MSRSTDEWIGKTDDDKVPDHVRLRIFRNANGICHITGRKIGVGEAWDLEHIVPLWSRQTPPGVPSGLHRESNLRPALKLSDDAHKAKTSVEAAERAKADRIAKRNLGLKTAKRKIQSRGFAPSDKEAKRAERRAFYHRLAEERRPIGAQ